MSFCLGLDTGGTYTDAALLDERKGVIVATAKALTTRHDLSIGVGEAMEKTLTKWGENDAGELNKIRMVCLSTTLATNAIVEGVGGAAGLVLIGFDDHLSERAGLKKALKNDPLIKISGGHKADGKRQAKFDADSLKKKLEDIQDQVTSFAIAAHFATRNMEDERHAAQIITEITGRFCSCSGDLSASLGGPRRALTALLNARLISLLDQLIQATEIKKNSLGLSCPLMVVKGDGSLVQAQFAKTRPIETILSGPAASMAGGAFLSGEKNAMVADIGGTTTDIAQLKNGIPKLSPDGAEIGGWKTMVEAAHIRTNGIGGDSEIRIAQAGDYDLTRGNLARGDLTRGNLARGDLAGGGANKNIKKQDPQTPLGTAQLEKIQLGPGRAIPLSLLALTHDNIKNIMKKQLEQPIAHATDGRFILPAMMGNIPKWMSKSETKITEILMESGMVALADLATTQVALGATHRLIKRGVLMVSGFTPTDAAHITKIFTNFDTDAAMLGGALLARQKSADGTKLAENEMKIARITLETLHWRSAMAIMDAGLAEEGEGEKLVSTSGFLSGLLHSNKDGSTAKNVEVTMKLSHPLVALGASAATIYPEVAQRINAQLNVPKYAEVAGAVGAAVGAVRQRVSILITQPRDDLFRIHLPDKLQDTENLTEALTQAKNEATILATKRAQAAGAKKIQTNIHENINEVKLNNQKTLFIQAIITAEATEI